MRRLLLTSSFTFVLGLSIGSFAIGQKGVPAVNEETQRPGKQDLVLPPGSVRATTERPDSQILAGLSDVAQTDRDGQGDALSNITLGPMSEAEQIRVPNSRWTELEGLVSRLVNRVDSLEHQAVAWKANHTSEQAEESGKSTAVLPVDTPDDRRFALVTAGVPETTAEEIVWRQSELELERLELRDQATREGWFRTDRYFESLRALNAEGLDLRAEIGEQAYDQYLFQTGESNRVEISALIPGSAAEQSGLMPGDIVESYGGEPVFSVSDLRNATTQGSRDEMVPVYIRRGDSFIEASVPRGPMGVRVMF